MFLKSDSWNWNAKIRHLINLSMLILIRCKNLIIDKNHSSNYDLYIYFLNNLRHNFRNKKLNYSPIILFFLLLNKIRLNQHWQSSKVNIYYEMHNIDSLIKFVYTRMTSWMQFIFFSNYFSIIINISWFYTYCCKLLDILIEKWSIFEMIQVFYETFHMKGKS